MGLFDKKTKKSAEFGDETGTLPVTVTSLPVQSASSAKAPVKVDHPDYGINKAIELMRMLPDDNVELIVRVVKTTLESTNINVAGIIKDATRKQSQIEARVDVLNQEIAKFETEIATRRGEITMLEADHKETSMVKERLELAEKLPAEAGRPAQRAATPSTAPASLPRAASTTESLPAQRADPTRS
ncbi:MAG: hypothetical protein H6Q90_2523 [Deltaproteobacteria bacterium]|nr:hypothetical protein [Deltaproteobacteria bacterium]